MADSIADVIRLFSTEASFLGASKQGQAGVTSDTRRWVVHNISDDTVHVGVSDDSLQMLIANNQNINGTKTFVPGINISNSTSGVRMSVVGNEFQIRLLNSASVEDMTFITDAGNVRFEPNGVLAMEVTNNAEFGLVMYRQLLLKAGEFASAPLRMPLGPSPTTPVDGEMWNTGTGLAFHMNSVTTSFNTGVGSPEGVVTAGPGALYTNTSGGASTTLYVKESGVGDTGWIAK